MQIETALKHWACIKASSYMKNCDSCPDSAECYEATREIEAILRNALTEHKE